MPAKILAVILALTMCIMFTAAGCRDSKSSSSQAASSSSSSTAQSSSSSADSTMPDEIIEGENVPDSAAEGASSMPNATAPDVNSQSNDNSMSSSEAAPTMAAASDSWQLRLVNASHPLPDDFTVETVPIKGYEERLFDARAADALQNMLAAAENEGRQLYLVSAYRSVARQKALFERKTQSFIAEGFPRKEAEAQAAMWVARAGTSEHNCGLAADIVSAAWYKTNNDLTAAFENTKEFEWLMQNAADYGFILRYPKGKENITGVTYEPWHFRYVGKKDAEIIMQKGITLEEYTNSI